MVDLFKVFQIIRINLMIWIFSVCFSLSGAMSIQQEILFFAPIDCILDTDIVPFGTPGAICPGNTDWETTTTTPPPPIATAEVNICIHIYISTPIIGILLLLLVVWWYLVARLLSHGQGKQMVSLRKPSTTSTHNAVTATVSLRSFSKEVLRLYKCCLQRSSTNSRKKTKEARTKNWQSFSRNHCKSGDQKNFDLKLI